MNLIRAAVGSVRKPKLDAVSEALADVIPLWLSEFGETPTFEVVGTDVPSGVSRTPLSRVETMAGARSRAEAVRRIAPQKHEPHVFFIGLEGGIDIVRENGTRWVFLENWAYVSHESGRGAFGQSGSILLPDALARSVVDDGIELSAAIDAFAGQTGIRDAQGAWGVLTRNLITRQDSYRMALINSFAALLQ